MDEQGLIKQAKNGDVGAYNTLVLHYQNIVYNVAFRILGDPDSAADASQDAFISAYKALGRFRGGSFKSWLMRIVTNACYDELRRRKRRRQSSLEELTDDNESSSILISDKGPQPEQHRGRTELVMAIESCLEKLPDDQRVAAILRDVEGYEYSEIAAMMSVSLGTVKSRLSRARAKMRDCLQNFAELIPAQYRHQS